MPDISQLRPVDYEIPVGTTGIIFVASLGGYQDLYDFSVFTIPALSIEWAIHRAASTLAWMALVNGQTFQFLRLSIPLTEAEAAVVAGYAPADVTSWEAGTEPVPVPAWQSLADRCCQIDSRAGITVTADPLDFRPRRIRIYPDIPFPPNPLNTAGANGDFSGCPPV